MRNTCQYTIPFLRFYVNHRKFKDRIEREIYSRRNWSWRANSLNVLQKANQILCPSVCDCANLSLGLTVGCKIGLYTCFSRGSVENATSEVIRFNDDVMLLKVDEKDCFVFSFGCLVCWGCTPQEVGAARDYVQAHLAKPVELAQVEVDFLSITGNASALPIATKARKIISTYGIMTLLIFSRVIITCFRILDDFSNCCGNCVYSFLLSKLWLQYHTILSSSFFFPLPLSLSLSPKLQILENNEQMTIAINCILPQFFEGMS